MSGLTHYFTVIANNGDTFIHNDNPNKATIHDDIIQYLMDSLNWITALAHCDTEQPIQGLCYYGITGFNQSLITPFKNLIIAWRAVFANTPDQFILTGSYFTIVGNDNFKGDYEKITVCRDELLAQLDTLIGYCVLVENDKNLILLHNGI
ncbi:hypothetical protein [Moraxella oblonga]|uniref:hypothetical protein n=1 Tax=Moraxella oblonga TaxID=200413 RepID=UPI000833DD6B|nr:hypothetical protein [Moraxella oblonga]